MRKRIGGVARLDVLELSVLAGLAAGLVTR